MSQEKGQYILKQQIFVVNMDGELFQKLRCAFCGHSINIHPVMSISEMSLDFFIRPCDLIIFVLSHFETAPLEELHIILCDRPMPVLILHADLSVEEKVCLYQIGASALLQKTIPAEICAAQALALIRLRTEIDDWPKQCPLIFGTELTIDPNGRIVKVNGEDLNITKKEFDLFLCLVRNRKQVLSVEQLYEEIWGDEPDEKKLKTVKSHIYTLRKKLSSTGKDYIQNSWGMGYRFIPPRS